MTSTLVRRLFEHNNWSNLHLLDFCLDLEDDVWDTKPDLAAYGSIRSTWEHIVASQVGYLRLLTLPFEQRSISNESIAFSTLRASTIASGEGFLKLIDDLNDVEQRDPLQTSDGYYVDAWVVVIQAINHATEHREQIKLILTSLGLTPPSVDGWAYGEVKKAVVPILL
ncbi:MAG: hypothetical protein GYB64_16020 [Chloroflexi bacterium]|nr:hypothetical protein [Chloroflexota bacterium]